MKRSVYLVGPPGSGKSTLTDSILEGMGVDLGPVRDLRVGYIKRRKLSALRSATIGQPLLRDGEELGVYLGARREQFPGTDAINKNNQRVAVEWALNGAAERVLGEGLRLGNKGFIGALALETDLLLIHLDAPDEVLLERRAGRDGDKITGTFAKTARTRAENLTVWAESQPGIKVLRVDTTSELAVRAARGKAVVWLLGDAL